MTTTIQDGPDPGTVVLHYEWYAAASGIAEGILVLTDDHNALSSPSTVEPLGDHLHMEFIPATDQSHGEGSVLLEVTGNPERYRIDVRLTLVPSGIQEPILLLDTRFFFYDNTGTLLPGLPETYDDLLQCGARR